MNVGIALTPRRTHLLRFLRRHGPMIAVSIALIAVVGGLTITLFVRSSAALEGQLRENLRAIAVSAASSIDGDDLANIRGPDDVKDPVYRDIAGALRAMMADIPQVRFAYILRRTDTPDTLAFVLDADTLSTPAALDRNGNGNVDTDEEPSYPGEQYDISDVPALQDEAFRMPTTDPEPTIDQWGLLLSGYAPIRSYTTGKVVAVLGIDMDAAEFRARTRSVLSPFAVMLIITLAGLFAGGVALLVESHQLQALERLNAERSGLLQLTFHQLGQPITILQWGIETLEDTKDDPAALQKVLPENLQDMREGIRRLSSIIDALQEAEKVELRVFENNPVELSLKHIVDDAVAVIAPAPADSPPRVLLDVVDAQYLVDPHLLTIVLKRLIENALEFSPATSAVRVYARDEGQWLRIDIADTGCGIPAYDFPHLFEKYNRASNAQSMKPDGNGLGLYIVKGIVELMGGVIRLSSVEGKGTTVTVRIPHYPVRHG